MISYQYFDTSGSSTETDEEAKSYSDDIDFAFFAVNFHYSKADYDALTEREKLFIRKEYESKTVTDTTLIRDAVFNAVWNVNRRKGRSFRPLWRKMQKPADIEAMKKDMKLIEEIEKNEHDWIARIYRENGMKMPEKVR